MNDNLNSIREEWSNFKSNYNKTYSNYVEEVYFSNIFKNNLTNITNLQPSLTYTIGVTKFTDLTYEDFIKKYTGLVISPTVTENHANAVHQYRHLFSTNVALPESYDLRSIMKISAVKDQGDCGSCWAFAANEIIEGYSSKHFNKILSPSIQQLVDCSYTYDGCNGGHYYNSLTYMMGGISDNKVYGYTASYGTCKYVQDMSILRTEGSPAFVAISEDPNAIMNAIYNYGPVAVCIGVDLGFQSYQKTNDINIWGSNPLGNNPPYNHAVVVIGWGSSNGNPYWIIKNSWGSSFGYDGYMYVSKETILKNAAVPYNVVEDIPSYIPSEGLSLGAIIGIALGAVVGVTIVVVIVTILAIYLVRRKSNNNSNSKKPVIKKIVPNNEKRAHVLLREYYDGLRKEMRNNNNRLNEQRVDANQD